MAPLGRGSTNLPIPASVLSVCSTARTVGEGCLFRKILPVSPAGFREVSLRSAVWRDGRRSEGDGPLFGLAWKSVAFGKSRELNLTHFTNRVGGVSRGEKNSELLRPFARHRLAMERYNELVAYSRLHRVDVEARLTSLHLRVIVEDHVLAAQQHALQFHQFGEFDHRLFAPRIIIHSVGGRAAGKHGHHYQKWYR